MYKNDLDNMVDSLKNMKPEEKEKFAKLMDDLGIKHKKRLNSKPMPEGQLDELRNSLSKTNFIDIIDNRDC